MPNANLLHSIQQKGLRITRVRIGLSKVLDRASAPLSASEVGIRLARVGLQPNKTTVYRELEHLEAEGLLEAIDFGDGIRRFELRGNHHHHLVCLRCKTVQDVQLERDLGEEEGRIRKHYQFITQRHALEFYGVCVRCT